MLILWGKTHNFYERFSDIYQGQQKVFQVVLTLTHQKDQVSLRCADFALGQQKAGQQKELGQQNPWGRNAKVSIA